MITGIDQARLAVAACAVLFGTAGTATAADVSHWDGDVRSSVRLLAGSRPANAAAALRAGIEIKLKEGWHTYWRYPGDAGVPPQFDFKGSQNLKQADVLYPAPQRLDEAGGVTIGYTRDVILPLRVLAQDRGKPVTLRLKLNYAICEKLCVPAEGSAELKLPAGAASQDAALAVAEGRVPKTAVLGENRALMLRSVRQEAGPIRQQVVVDVAAPEGADVALFAEGPTTQWALPVPMPVDGAPSGLRRFVFELDGAPPGASYQGAKVLLTAVTAADAIEVAIRLD